MYSCLDENGQATREIYRIFNVDTYLGYFVYDTQTEQIIEFSRGVDAFSRVMDRYDISEPVTLYYKGFINEIVCEDITISFDEFENTSTNVAMENEQSAGTYTILPNPSPQEQGGRNCIVAAMANLVYY